MENHEQWKQCLERRLIEHLKPRKVRPGAPLPLELKTAGRVYAYISALAACSSIVFGHAITAREAQACIASMSEDDYVGGAWLVLEGLDDWGVVKATVLPNGITAYPLARPVGVAEKLRQTHNHSFLCLGCESLP